jgi:hypothetical protein
MKNTSKRTMIAAATALLCAASAGRAMAFPVDPAKVPVAIGQTAATNGAFTLAYDDANSSIVYYAPKGGRTASLNGMPLVGFVVLPGGQGYLNAQLEFGVFGGERINLIDTIMAAGKIPVPFPYNRTTIVPLTPGIDPTTGRPICVETEDLATGELIQECDPTLYDALEYSRKGPALGENIAFTAILNPIGAAVFGTMLRQGIAFQANVEAEYYAAGTSFTATVRVSYDKLFENFHVYAGFDGFFTQAEVEAAWRNEGLCLHRRPEDCGISVTYRDCA